MVGIGVIERQQQATFRNNVIEGFATSAGAMACESLEADPARDGLEGEVPGRVNAVQDLEDVGRSRGQGDGPPSLCGPELNESDGHLHLPSVLVFRSCRAHWSLARLHAIGALAVRWRTEASALETRQSKHVS
jgi:hypothetical protein